MDPRFSSRGSPLDERDSFFVLFVLFVLLENHFLKKNGLESPLIFVFILKGKTK